MSDQPELTREFWLGKRVFITGHTGFKGTWLSFWLSCLGADVRGYALPPNTTPSAFDALAMPELIEHVEGDVRDAGRVARELREFAPEVVFHLAAQPLVRESYRSPVETYATNVMGTVHVLDAVRATPSVRAVIVVTTDKCYENHEWVWGYRETDRLGGHDPYSNSKACAELVTASYRDSFFSNAADSSAPVVASARAGNVLGGGDWSADRLIPDAVRAVAAGEELLVRRPSATRPWQHVLEPLSGYLRLAERSYAADRQIAGGWNFGPRDQDVVPVGRLMQVFTAAWADGAAWRGATHDDGPHEASLLKLDISKASALLGWHPRWNIETCVRYTVDWYKAFYATRDAATLRDRTHAQIQAYTTAASLAPTRT